MCCSPLAREFSVNILDSEATILNRGPIPTCPHPKPSMSPCQRLALMWCHGGDRWHRWLVWGKSRAVLSPSERRKNCPHTLENYAEATKMYRTELTSAFRLTDPKINFEVLATRD